MSIKIDGTGVAKGLCIGTMMMDHLNVSTPPAAPLLTIRRAAASIAASLAVLIVLPAISQPEALRQRDDQFIQGLREQGMSELFERYRDRVADDENLDPITRLELTITQKEFQATDLRKRAIAAAAQDPAQAQALFGQSRVAYEEMLAAMEARINEHPNDERLPIWEVDLAKLLLTDYLRTYHQNAAWFYEFGVVSDEQRAAFERSAALAHELVAHARYLLERLPSRLGESPALREELETLGILYDLQSDYKQRYVPFWFGYSAHYVALLPDSHAYYQSLGANARVRNQKSNPAEERLRLREEAETELTGSLLNDSQVALAARLLAGQITVQHDDLDLVDEGVADYLDPVISSSSDAWQGFLATLAKARGREAAGELDTAIDILSGMENHPYVSAQQNEGNIRPRILAADLMHRMLLKQVDAASGDEAVALRSVAYEQAYLPLIENDPRGQFAPYLFRRWSASVDDESDPAKFPPVVRMGVGQMLTETGGAQAQALVNLAKQRPLEGFGVPTEREAEAERRSGLRVLAESDLNRAARFNNSLIGEEVEGAIRARGLFGLGFNKYYLAELSKFYDDGESSFEPYLEVATLWYTLGHEIPDAEQAERAAAFSASLHTEFDRLFNSDAEVGVRRPDLRQALKDAANSLYTNWPSNDTAHKLRLYVGYVFESGGELETAVAIYRDLPSQYPGYFEARRQMVFAQHRIYEGMTQQAQILASSAPAEDSAEDVLLAYADEVDRLNIEISRASEDLFDDAELLDVDAEDALADSSLTPKRRFSAVTAQGAAIIVTAALEADAEADGADAALEILNGFERIYSPTESLSQLVSQQADPEMAAKTLNQLIQGAQERRILALVYANRLNEVSEVAQTMFDAYPAVAAGVVDDVLVQLEVRMAVYAQSEKDAPLPIQQDRAREARESTATVAVDLSEQLLAWARGQDLPANRVLPYELSFARALLMANRPGDASEVMTPLLEAHPGDFSICLLGADCMVMSLMTDGVKDVARFNDAIEQYNKIITYYNAQQAVQPIYWRAWLQIIKIHEYLGGEYSKKIPSLIDNQRRGFPDMGGVEFEEQFDEYYRRHAN